MSRILDYVLEPNVVYTNGAFLIKVKVQDDYKYKKYLVSESMKYTTATGTTFTLTNAVSTNNASILQLEGNTTQNGTPTPTSPVEVKTVSGDNDVVVCGKNKFNKNKAQIGKAWNNSSNTARAILITKVEPNTSYTISYQSLNGVELYWFGRANENDSTRTTDVISITSSPKTITTNATTNYLGLQFNKTSIAQSDIDNCNMQLEKGTTATTYEPYTGNSYRVDFGGGNQLPQDKYIESRTTNGITYTNNGNGTFSLSGTASANTSIQIIPYNNINIQNGKSYYLLSNVPYNSNTFNMSVRFKEDTTQRYLIANGTVTVSSTATISNVDLAFWINSGNTVNAQNVKLMLVEGNTAPSRYSPYVSNPIELCKIGNYKDTLFHAVAGNPTYDSLDSATKESLTYGNWYIEKNIGKRLITTDIIDSISTNVLTVSKEARVLKSVLNCLLGNSAQYFCNTFRPVQSTWNDDQIGIMSTGGSSAEQVAFRIPVDSDRSYFNTHPTTLYYQLANPTYETITNENLIQQLEQIQDIELIENLCYVDWVGSIAPTMLLQYPTNETLNAYLITEDNKLIRTDWRFIGRRK